MKFSQVIFPLAFNSFLWSSSLKRSVAVLIPSMVTNMLAKYLRVVVRKRGFAIIAVLFVCSFSFFVFVIIL